MLTRTYYCRTATIVNIVIYAWNTALFVKAGEHIHVLHGKIGGYSAFQDVGPYLSMDFPFACVKTPFGTLQARFTMNRASSSPKLETGFTRNAAVIGLSCDVQISWGF